MKEIRRVVIPTLTSSAARSLCWQGDDLIDWVGGGTRYRLDGSVVPSWVNYAYVFDHAVASPDGHYAAIVQRLGTKGLLLKDGEILREINRSFYNANAYEYPIAFLTLPNGKIAIAHCPDNYAKLEIEEVESGTRLTQRDSPSIDFFHSRLSVSSDNRYLLSAGWVWSPFDDVWLYNIERVLAQPALLDSRPMDRFARTGVGINAAAFTTNGQLVFTTNDEWYDPGDVTEAEADLPPPAVVSVYDPAAKQLLSQAPLEEIAGTLMPVGGYAVGFYQHPELINLATGAVEARWDDLWSGEQTSSILWHIKPPPPLALDAANRRFAVASADAITVVQLGETT